MQYSVAGSKQRKGPRTRPVLRFDPLASQVFRRFTPWRPLDPPSNQRPSSADGIRWAAGVWVSVTRCSRPVAGWEPTTITTCWCGRGWWWPTNWVFGFWGLVKKGGMGLGVWNHGAHPVRLLCCYRSGSCVCALGGSGIPYRGVSMRSGEGGLVPRCRSPCVTGHQPQDLPWLAGFVPDGTD